MKFNIKSVSYGDFVALRNVNFETSAGQVTAIVGRNGAGKSTLINALLGLSVNMQGVNSIQKSIKKDLNFVNKIGYVPEIKSMESGRTIRDQIVFQAGLKGMSRRTTLKKLKPLMDEFDVVGEEKTRLSKLSKGNQQKIQIIGGIIHDPNILILAEPFSGLDPINAQLLYQKIVDMKKSGTMLLISSHNMDALEKVADTILVIKKGQQVFFGDRDDLRARSSFSEIKVKLSYADYQKVVSEIAFASTDFNQATSIGVFEMENLNRKTEFVNYLKKNNLISDYYDGTGPDLETIFKELA